MKRLAYAAFIALGLIWGSNFLFMKWATTLLSPAQIVLLRVFFGFVPILLMALIRGALRWSQLRDLPHFVVMSILATIAYYYAFAAGTALLPSGVAGVLAGAIPLFSFITAWLFLREESLNWRSFTGITLGFVGILWVASPWQSTDPINPQGVFYMILGSLSVGSSFIYARRFLSKKGYSPLALASWQTGLALLILIAITDTEGITAIHRDHIALIGLVGGLGLLGTGGAYALYYFLIEQLGALRAASVTYVPPVVALIIGHVYAAEPLRTSHLMAVTLILGGVFLLQTAQKKREQ